MKLFRPHRIVSNTLDPGMANLDWIAIDNMFKDCLLQLDSWAEFADGGRKGDVALKNLEGGREAIGLAVRRMSPDERGSNKLQNTSPNRSGFGWGGLSRTTRAIVKRIRDQNYLRWAIRSKVVTECQEPW